MTQAKQMTTEPVNFHFMLYIFSFAHYHYFSSHPIWLKAIFHRLTNMLFQKKQQQHKHIVYSIRLHRFEKKKIQKICLHLA